MLIAMFFMLWNRTFPKSTRILNKFLDLHKFVFLLMDDCDCRYGFDLALEITVDVRYYLEIQFDWDVDREKSL